MFDNLIPKQEELGEIVDSEKALWSVLRKRGKSLVLWSLFSVLWSAVCFKYLPRSFFEGEFGFYIAMLPWIGFAVLIGSIYSQIRTAFWKQLAVKYGWQYTTGKATSEEKALIFKLGNSQESEHGISGTYNNQPFHIFEYNYTVGSGKNKTVHAFTVFEVKFTGTFPHIYLNYKKDSHSLTPSDSSVVAKLSLPKEFEDRFKLYSPKEYEIETLEIFTPDLFAHLIDSKWNHDMEFVDGELVIYRKVKFTNFEALDAELNRIKKFIDILSPQLNRLKLTQIGDISPTFTSSSHSLSSF